MAYALLRLRRLQTRSEPVSEVNIIPVIDISLVLLVILFVTAPLLSYPNLPLQLPRGGAASDDDAALAVTLAGDGSLAVRSESTAWERLEPRLAAELARRPESLVLLRVDKTVPYREVQRLLAAAKAAGARRIAFGTEPR